MSTALPSSLSEMQPPLPAALIGLMMLGVRTARLAWAQLYLRVTQVGGRQLSKEGFASWIHPRKKKKIHLRERISYYTGHTQRKTGNRKLTKCTGTSGVGLLAQQ